MLGTRKYWPPWADTLPGPSVLISATDLSLSNEFQSRTVAEASLYSKEREVALLATSLIRYTLLSYQPQYGRLYPYR
jgi:hypothetical protein